MLSKNMIIRKNLDLMEAEMDNELVMMSLENNAYYGLDRVGKVIWQMLETPQSIDAIADQLIKRFDVSKEQCLEDIMPFFEKLLDQQMISVGP